MKTKWIIGLSLLVLACGTPAQAGLVLDPDTGKWIEEGFDVRLYATMLAGQSARHGAFGRGGSFGTDLYVVTVDTGPWPPDENNLYRSTPDGHATLITSLPTTINKVAFPHPGSAFGGYLYLGSDDSYWAGNKNVYRAGASGNLEVFIAGSNFSGGMSTYNGITFSAPGGPFGDHLSTQDSGLDRVLRHYREGSAELMNATGSALNVDAWN